MAILELSTRLKYVTTNRHSSVLFYVFFFFLFLSGCRRLLCISLSPAQRLTISPPDVNHLVRRQRSRLQFSASLGLIGPEIVLSLSLTVSLSLSHTLSLSLSLSLSFRFHSLLAPKHRCRTLKFRREEREKGRKRRRHDHRRAFIRQYHVYHLASCNVSRTTVKFGSKVTSPIRRH